MKVKLFFLVWFSSLQSLGVEMTAPETRQIVSSLTQETIQNADAIWHFAELGYRESESSAQLANYLEKAGFEVTRGVADIPTAFVASAGSGGPHIGILAEFDALPGLSQDAVATRSPIIVDAPGHACGHHLFGAASAAAAIAISRWMAGTDTKGTVSVFGTPAEEGGSGKVYMARAGLFRDLDIVLHWHPGDNNGASPSSTNANKSGRFEFHGIAAHAASAPHRGRSALDGVEAMNHMVNMMREHVPSNARLHYVITDGGDAPNIVPEFAEVYYYVRHPQVDRVNTLFERLVDAARGAALGTGTRMQYEVMHGNYPVLRNDALAQIVYDEMTALGGFSYSSTEQFFAETIFKTFIQPVRSIGSQETIRPFQFRQSMGSTDVGDVSWMVPTAGFTTATWVPGTPGHSWQAVASGGMSIGHKGMMMAAKVLAATAERLYRNSNLIDGIRTEFEERRGPQFRYQALLGDRQPPLNYRK